MKLKAKLALLLCVLLISSLFLSACKTTQTKGNDTLTSDTTDQSLIKITEEYRLIRPDNDSEPLIASIQKISQEFKEKAALSLALDTDWLKKDAPIPEKEILIGLTNREESINSVEGLLYDEFLITAIGEKIIIIGGSDEATEKAADYFIENYINTEITISKNLFYRFSMNYPVENIKLSGVDIKNYKIVYSPMEKSIYFDVAQNLNKKLVELCGITLDIVYRTASSSPYEILLGNTGRDESDLITVSKTTEYGLGVKGSKIMLSGGCLYAANTALEEIILNYLSDDLTGEVNIKLKDFNTISELSYQSDLVLLSNNVLSSSTAKDRASLLYDIYMSYNADIIGLQECNSTHYSNLVTRLRNNGYSMTANTIDNKNNAMSYTPILYKTDKYTLIADGCFLYDQRYMATNTKTLSYAVFKDKETGQKFGIINTHFAIIIDSYPDDLGTNSVEGAMWREDNARQVKETYAKLIRDYGNIPIFAMGDFNCNSSSDAYKSLTVVFDDAINTAQINSTNNTASWHNVGQLPQAGGSPIDHIFMSKGSSIFLTHEIPLEQNVLDSTDHCPVIVEIEFK